MNTIAAMKRLLPILLLVLFALPLHAGMPMVTVTDAGRMRLETISLFLVILALCVVAVRWLWNSLCPTLPSWPRLGWKGAIGVVGVWSLAVLLVLAMIGGARELMTPGAWAKQGLTYQLVDRPGPSARLELLKLHLTAYATTHGGAYPAHDLGSELPPEVWTSGHPSAARFRYLPGQRRDGPTIPLAWDPPEVGDVRQVLFTDGAIREIPAEQLRDLVTGAAKP